MLKKTIRGKIVAASIASITLATLTLPSFGRNLDLTNIQVPVRNFAVIDISAAVSGSYPVCDVALDDNGNAAFGLDTDYDDNGNASNYNSYQWINGVVHHIQTLLVVPEEISTSDGIEIIYTQPGVYGSGSALLANGAVYGHQSGFNITTNIGLPRVGFQSENGTPEDFGPPDSPYGEGPCSDLTLCAISANGYCGVADGRYVSYDSNGRPQYTNLSGGVIVSGSQTVIFDHLAATLHAPVATGAQLVDAAFMPILMNDKGWAVGMPTSEEDPQSTDGILTLWNGTNLVNLESLLYGTIALNDQGDVIDTDLSGSGYLFQNGIKKPIQDLLPKLCQSQFSYLPFLISNRNQTDGTTKIVLGAGQDVFGTDPDWIAPVAMVILSGTASVSGSSTPIMINLPPGVNAFFTGMNANGIFSAIGTVTTTGSDGVPSTSGTDALFLVPEDIIQVDAFIPQTYVPEIVTYYLDNGNSRKNPLDHSFTNGTAIFTKDSPEFKVRQTMDVCAFPNYDSDGSQEVATKKTTVGQTRRYDPAVLVNGEIPAGANPVKTATATPVTDTATVSHPSASVVTATLQMKISNPMIPNAPPIHYTATVTIDRSNPSQPTYTVSGTSCEFPAYEIYINGQRIHHFDPEPEGYTPFNLSFFDINFNNSGNIDQ